MTVEVPIATTPEGELLERDEPLRVLAAALKAAEDGRGSVVVVSGEPGIGKSCLVAHFTHDVAHRARVLVGVCDELATPRPLGAVRDVADQLAVPVIDAPRDSQRPAELAGRLVHELRHAALPTVLVVEDVHWSDQATLDVLRVVGRRVAELPVVLVLTLRPGELRGDDPLRVTIDAMRRSTTRHLELAPLSRAAVARVAGDRADRIYELSGGNPFYVSELLAGHDDAPPPSLSTAVLARVGRLERPTRELVELIAVVPGRVRREVFDHVDPAWEAAIEPAERRGLLHVDARQVRFRHELARSVTCASLPRWRRRLLHRHILEALLQLEPDPAEVVHHAQAAGLEPLAAEYALAAGQQAAASGAHREALAHLRHAAGHAQQHLTPVDRAGLHEQLATSAWLTGHLEEAVAAATTAIELAGTCQDPARHGRCLALRSHIHWFGGDGRAARRDVAEAVRHLEASGPSPELARALAQAAELSMALSRTTAALHAGQRALELPGGEGVRSRALTAIGGARLQLDVDDARVLHDAIEVARAAGDTEQVVFALVTRAVIQLLWALPDRARSHAVQARTVASDQQLDGPLAFIDAFLAWLDVRESRPEGVASLTGPGTSRDDQAVASLAEQQRQLVLAEHAVRRGADDAEQRLAQVTVSAERSRKLVHLAPVFELHVELALTRDLELPIDRLDELVDLAGAEALGQGCAGARVAAWARVCGRSMQLRGWAPAPHAAMIAGDWAAAADAFGAIGWRHDRALLLSLLGTRDALEESLALARDLGSVPLAQRVCRRLRSAGLTVPRGPRASTRANPWGLTDRQLEVLRHLGAGCSNGEIAALLHLSSRTVEHHVAAILAKLDVPSRAAAVARCAELDLTATQTRDRLDGPRRGEHQT